MAASDEAASSEVQLALDAQRLDEISNAHELESRNSLR